MPEYDAFGREIGEDTLAGLGGRDATIRPQPAPTPGPAEEEPRTAPPPEAPVVTTPDAPPQRIRPRRAGGLGCLVGLVILAAVIAGPIIAVVSIVGSASDTIDGVTGVLDDIATIDPSDVPGTPDAPAPPLGIEGRSMIAPGNVAGAFKRLRGDGVKTVSRITIWPDRLEAGTVKGRRERSVQLTYDGSVQRGDATGANRALGTIALADLDPEAPARLVRNSAKRFPVRERRINYLIAMDDVFSGGGHRWIAYFKNGIYVEGDERGRVIRRIS